MTGDLDRKDEYEIRCYRVVWYLELGWIGDSEGITWAKGLRYKEQFPTQEKAMQAMEDHPETVKDEWGQWRTTYGYGVARVRRIEEALGAAE